LALDFLLFLKQQHKQPIVTVPGNVSFLGRGLQAMDGSAIGEVRNGERENYTCWRAGAVILGLALYLLG
jgi:hypothetical protein